MLATALSLVLTLWPAQAPAGTAPAVDAQDPAAQANQTLLEAQHKLAALDDEGARALAAPLADDPTLPPALRARAAVTTGVALAHLGRADEARNTLALALGQDPNVAPPVVDSPAVGQAWEDAKAQVAAPRTAPAALPAKAPPVRENALGWVRPTSYVVMGAGAVVLVMGVATALGAFAWREYVYRFADAANVPQYSRLLFPLAVAAAVFILLAIPTAGTGLALWFLSGEDGPLRESRVDTAQEDPAPVAAAPAPQQKR